MTPAKSISKSAVKSAAVSALPYVVGIAAIGGLAYGIYSVVNSAFTDKNEEEQEEEVNDVVDIPTKDGSTRPNISEAEASSIAKSHQTAMEGIGTDESLLFSTLEGLNGKALQLVYSKFGLRLWWGGGYWPAWAGGDRLDLFGWYRGELTQEELVEMAEIWDKSGLKPIRTGMNGIAIKAQSLL